MILKFGVHRPPFDESMLLVDYNFKFFMYLRVIYRNLNVAKYLMFFIAMATFKVVFAMNKNILLQIKSRISCPKNGSKIYLYFNFATLTGSTFFIFFKKV